MPDLLLASFRENFNRQNPDLPLNKFQRREE